MKIMESRMITTISSLNPDGTSTLIGENVKEEDLTKYLPQVPKYNPVKHGHVLKMIEEELIYLNSIKELDSDYSDTAIKNLLNTKQTLLRDT